MLIIMKRQLLSQQDTFHIDVIKCKVSCLPISTNYINDKIGVSHSFPDTLLILQVVWGEVDLA